MLGTFFIFIFHIYNLLIFKTKIQLSTSRHCLLITVHGLL